MSPFLSFVRRLRPADVLLPIGAALVSAGLQHLADREARQRARLDELAALAGDHLQAFAAAGVPVPEELAADEPHPLDPGIPWLVQHATPEADEPDEIPPRTNWKLAVLALGAVAGVVTLRRTGFLAALVDRGIVRPGEPTYAHDADCNTKHEPGPDPCPEPVSTQVDDTRAWGPAGLNHPGSDRWTGGDRKDDDVPGVKPDLTPDPIPDGYRPGIVHHEFEGEEQRCSLCDRIPEHHRAAAGDECGWPNCGYTPPEDLPPEDQVLALAVHRNQCVYRPAGAHVPGA